MRNKLTGLLLLIVFVLNAQIPDLKMVTSEDLSYLIINEGFIQKSEFDITSKKALTKAEIIARVYLDDTGSLNSYAYNQLVPRIYLVPIAGGLKGFMMTYGNKTDNLENQNDHGTVDSTYLHNGNYTLPTVGDQIYKSDGSIYNYSQNVVYTQPFHGAQRYPSIGNEYVNLKINTSGIVSWAGWVTDENDLPTGVAATDISYYSFTLNWSGGTAYHNLRYFIEQEQLEPSVLPWTVYQILDNDNIFTDGYNFSFPITNVNRSNWRIRSVETSHRNHEKWDKVSAEIEVDPLKSFNFRIYSTEQSSQMCEPISGISALVYSEKPLADVVAGDYLYTDKELTNRWIPSHTTETFFWLSEGETIGLRISGSDGYISGAGTCQ